MNWPVVIWPVATMTAARECRKSRNPNDPNRVAQMYRIARRLQTQKKAQNQLGSCNATCGRKWNGRPWFPDAPCSFKQSGCHRSDGGPAVVAEESAVCVGRRPRCTSFHATGCRRCSQTGAEESFFFHHFRATSGIFPQGPAHLIKPWAQAVCQGWLDRLSVRCLSSYLIFLPV
jgi:hypothetical protein